MVGLPVSFDGQLHGQARANQAFAAKLRERIHSQSSSPTRRSHRYAPKRRCGRRAYGLIASASGWTRRLRR